MTPINILDIKNRQQFRQWLIENHATERECWVVACHSGIRVFHAGCHRHRLCSQSAQAQNRIVINQRLFLYVIINKPK